MVIDAMSVKLAINRLFAHNSVLAKTPLLVN
jgi:hypothetical protein